MPAVAEQSDRVGFDAFGGGFLATHLTSLPGHFSGGPHGHQSISFALCSGLDADVEDPSPVPAKHGFDSFARLGEHAQGQGDSCESKFLKSFYFTELCQGEVARVPQHEVVFQQLDEELASDSFVLFGRAVKGMGDHDAGEEIVAEIDLHSGGAAMSVTTGREDRGVGFGHGLDRGVLHQADHTPGPPVENGEEKRSPKSRCITPVRKAVDPSEKRPWTA